MIRMTPEALAKLLKAPVDGLPKPKRKKQPPPVIPWEAWGLPSPVNEHRFCERQWRFDYAWPAKMVALECEGGIWTRGRHNRGKGMLSDIQKYNRAAVLGWAVIRCTPQQIESGAIFDTLKQAMRLS